MEIVLAGKLLIVFFLLMAWLTLVDVAAAPASSRSGGGGGGAGSDGPGMTQQVTSVGLEKLLAEVKAQMELLLIIMGATGSKMGRRRKRRA
jgi:hypothetical protein